MSQERLGNAGDADPTAERPEGLTFKPANDNLSPESVRWVKTTDGCPECRARGGWTPVVDQSACPVCYGEDEYGQGSYCGECDYCCGC